MERDFYLMALKAFFGIKGKSIILTHKIYFGYCYKYTRSAYDWFCAPGSQI